MNLFSEICNNNNNEIITEKRLSCFQHVKVQQSLRQARSHQCSQPQRTLILQSQQQQLMLLHHHTLHSMSYIRRCRLSSAAPRALPTSCPPFHCCWIPIYCRAQKFPLLLHNWLRYRYARCSYYLFCDYVIRDVQNRFFLFQFGFILVKKNCDLV